jgi:hypothetical protein
MTPTNKSIIIDTDRDAYPFANYTKHCEPWKKITHKKLFKHAPVEPGRPSVGESRADQTYRTEPGLYSAPINKKPQRSVTILSGTGRGHPTPTTKMKPKAPSTPSNRFPTKFIDAGYRETGMPSYLVKELNELDTAEFKHALDYWMNHFNFAGEEFTPAAYDESRYPNPEQKRKTHLKSPLSLNENRTRALGFACNTLMQYARLVHEGNRFAGHIHQQILNVIQDLEPNYRTYFEDTTYEPDILSAAYYSALLLDPTGHKTFTTDIDNDNRQHDMIQRIKRTRKTMIRLWRSTSELVRELNVERTRKEEPIVQSSIYMPFNENTTDHHERRPNGYHKEGRNLGNKKEFTRESYNRQEYQNAPHYAYTTRHEETPHMTKRLQQAITPGMTEIPKTPSVVINIGSNPVERTATPTSPPPIPETTEPALDNEEISESISTLYSDPDHITEQLRETLELAEENEMKMCDKRETHETYTPMTTERKESPTSNKRYHSKKKKSRKEKKKSRTKKRSSKYRKHQSPDGVGYT